MNLFTNGTLPHELDTLAVASKVSGALSLSIWLFAQLPQVLENYLNQSVAGVSPAFLFCWMCGDSTNLIGCILTRALPFQLSLAVYYCFIDLILGIQFWYYTSVYPKQPVHHNMLQSPNMLRPVRSENMTQTLLARLNRFETLPTLLVPQRSSSSRRGRRGTFFKKVLASLVLSNSFKKASAQPITETNIQSPQWDLKLLVSSAIQTLVSLAHRVVYSRDAVGAISGWTSTAFYIVSRLPQILQNYRAKSTKGVSPYVFLFAMSGNICYTFSIVTDLYLLHKYESYLDTDFDLAFRSQLPFVVGSAGTVILDAILLLQVRLYRVHSNQVAAKSSKRPSSAASLQRNRSESVSQFTKSDWYTNNFPVMEDEPFKDFQEPSKYMPTSFTEPNETTGLLRESSIITPPLHYIISTGQEEYHMPGHKRNFSDTFNAIAKSLSRSSFVKSLSAMSTNGSVRASPAPGTSLIPSLVGTYSSLSKRMLDESRKPLLPIDFLHNDYIQRGNRLNTDRPY